MIYLLFANNYVCQAWFYGVESFWLIWGMVFIGLECANYFGLDAKKGLMAAKTTKNFEKSLSELEGIVEKMENGDLSLEESMKQFEKGVELTRICQTALDQAEQKVMLLSTNQEDDSETEFDIDQ